MNQELAIQGIKVSDLLKKYGSPLYVYDEDIIKRQSKKLIDAISAHFQNGDYKILYACKANTNIHFMKAMKEAGINGIDAVSPFEVEMALMAGFQNEDITYTENFISLEDLEYALNKNINLNIGELKTLERITNLKPGAEVSIRLNLDIGIGHHSHVVTGGHQSKFGIYYDKFKEQIQFYAQKLKIVALHQHIGSKIMKKDEESFLESVKALLKVCKELNLKDLKHINIGGGLGVSYQKSESVMELSDAFGKVHALFKEYFPINTPQLVVEPGRFLSAESGILLCTVTALNQNPTITFVGTDSGMNHLIRPALYDSYHGIINASNQDGEKGGDYEYTICGNICESGDYLGRNRRFQYEIKEGDILGVLNAGAYCYSMASNYNGRGRPSEVMIRNKEAIQIRKRENLADLLKTTIKINEY